MTEVSIMQSLLQKYGGVPDDHFKIWPENKFYFINEKKNAGLAYAVKNHVAVVVGAPVGKVSEIVGLIMKFQLYCHEKKWQLAFCNVTQRFKDSSDQFEFNNIMFAQMAIVDIPYFIKNTIKSNHFKMIMRRGERNNWQYVKSQPPHSQQLIDEISTISDEWRKLPGRRDWTFFSSPHTNDYINQTSVRLVNDSNGKPQAFLNEVPAYSKGVATFDLMRRRPDSQNGMMDYLLSCYIQELYKRGFKHLSLGVAFMDIETLDLPKTIKKTMKLGLHKLLSTPYKSDLSQFKNKFEPKWEPRYILYFGNQWQAVKTAVAIYQLMNAN